MENIETGFLRCNSGEDSLWTMRINWRVVVYILLRPRDSQISLTGKGPEKASSSIEAIGQLVDKSV